MPDCGALRRKIEAGSEAIMALDAGDVRGRLTAS